MNYSLTGRNKRRANNRATNKTASKYEIKPDEQGSLSTICLIHLSCGCAFSYIFAIIPIGRYLLRSNMALLPLHLEFGLIEVAFFTGDILGIFLSIYLLEKCMTKSVSAVFGIFCICGSLIGSGFAVTFEMLALCRCLLGICVGITTDSLFKQFPAAGDLYRLSTFFSLIAGISLGPCIGLLADLPPLHLGNPKLERTLTQYPFLLPSVTVAALFIFVLLFSLICPNYAKKSRKLPSFRGASNISYRALGSTDEEDASDTREHNLDATTHGTGFEIGDNSQISVVTNSSSSDKAYASKTLLDESNGDVRLSIGSPISPTDSPDKDRDKKAKNRVLFSTMVTVKIIGSPTVEYDHLKHLCKDEEPIPINTEKVDVELNSYPVYTNGSKQFMEEVVVNFSGKNIAKLLSKESVLVCLVMNGLVGVTVMYSVELLQLNFLNSQTYSTEMFALFELLCGCVTILATALTCVFLTMQYGSLYIYYRIVQSFILLIALLFLLPFAFEDLPESLYHVILWTFSSLVCSCCAIFVLLTFTFTNNSCYNHEKIVVNRTGQVFFALGLLSGSYIGSSLFSLSEWLRNIFSTRMQLSWILPIILAHLLLLIAKRLPKKIQRSMREPLKPRYAISMQGDSGENLLEGYQNNLFDDMDGLEDISTLDNNDMAPQQKP